MKHTWHSLQKDKTSSYRTNDIEVLSEWLESLKITNKALERTNKQTDKEILIVLEQTNENIQTMILKSIVLDLEWFNGDRMKFED